jgi:AraC-like DNA-binding protein
MTSAAQSAPAGIVMPTFSLPHVASKGAPSASRPARIVAAGIVSETVYRKPDPHLAGVVTGEYQGWKESSAEVVRRREVPDCAIPFIINFGTRFRVLDPNRPADGPQTLGTFVAGMYDSFVVVESYGDSCCIQVNFTLLGARLFFQLPLCELSNRVVGLDELYGDQAAHAVDALAEAGNWDRRFDVLEALILQRIASAKPPRREIQWAWRLMQARNGNPEIGALARELGWSHKHLITQFRDQLGAPPKYLARVLRFQRAIEAIDNRRPIRWAELALSCGYFDQSHMIREFRQLAGCTPEGYVGFRLSYGGVSAGPASQSENSTSR